MSENTELFTNADDAISKASKPQKIVTILEETPLQKLTSVIKAKVERPIVHLDVPERAGVTVRVSPNITQNQMRQWRKQSGEDSRNGMDATKFACLVIGSTTVGICLNGEEVRDENDYEINFASDKMWEMTETTRSLDAVRAFFGVDPHIEAAALAILDAAGYSDTVETVDPTKESSNN
jgi:hypothetical protein